MLTLPYIKGIPEFMQAVLARLVRTILRETLVGVFLGLLGGLVTSS